MKIGSLFSGIGGLDLACEQVFEGQTVWQVEREPYCQKVLAARWPDAERFDDVTQVSADVLEPVDVLCGGFPCQDLSIAGKRAGLDGTRSGLYSEMMRLVSELRPRFVVFENVPALMKYRERVHDDLAALGYGSRWQMCQASDVGAPHRRRRVFVLAIRDASGCIVLPRPSEQRDLFAPVWSQRKDKLWPTALADGDRRTMFAQGGEPLGHAVRWPTPCASDGQGSRSVPQGTSPTGKRPNGTKAMISLQAAARWPTPCARDYKSGTGCTEVTQNKRNGTAQLPEVVGGCLNPAWVELLMGLPVGWTIPDADVGTHQWPMGRGEAQAAHEPPRLVPPRSLPHRAARLRALGNAVVPQQAAAALTRMLAVQP